MKKLSLFLLLFTSICFASFSQDMIVKKNAEELKAKVLEVTDSDIKYKKFDNQEGPTYTIKKAEVLFIKYQNGDKDVFNQPATGAQNTVEPEKPQRSGYFSVSLGGAVPLGTLSSDYYEKLQGEKGAGGFSLDFGYNIWRGYGIKAMISSYAFVGKSGNADIAVANVITGVGPQFSSKIGSSIDINSYLVLGSGGVSGSAGSGSNLNVIASESGLGMLLGLNARIPANTTVAFIPSINWQTTYLNNSTISNLSINVGIGFNFGKAAQYW